MAGPIAAVWLAAGLAAFGFAWFTVLRYVLHLVACGHVAVLTDLIVHGRVRDGNEGMVAYGIKTVRARVRRGERPLRPQRAGAWRGRRLQPRPGFLEELLPLPGLDGLVKLAEAVLRMATTYLDKTIFSYNLARGDGNPWRSGREGLVYYCQNARPILTSALWILTVDVLLTVALWLLMLLPSIPVALLLPSRCVPRAPSSTS